MALEIKREWLPMEKKIPKYERPLLRQKEKGKLGPGNEKGGELKDQRRNKWNKLMNKKGRKQKK